MAKLEWSLAMAAIVFGMPPAAYAQAAISPHLHAPPPATAAQPAPTQPQQKADHRDGCQCPCCQMEKRSSDAGCKQKMMQGHGAQDEPASTREHEKH